MVGGQFGHALLLWNSLNRNGATMSAIASG
jgi:hypothetical protein